MRATLGLIAFTLASPAQADVAIPIPALIARPANYVGKDVIVRKLRCVDPGGAGFVCVGLARRRALRIRATSLGALTELPIAKTLIGPCKGVDGLDKLACTFDVAITPTSQVVESGTGNLDAVTVLVAPAIDLWRPIRLPRR